MARRLTALSLFAAALLALAAGAQQPEKKADVKADKKAPPDAAIEAALANDPDVKMARAKIQLAEAEYAKARQAVTHKVLTLRSQIAEQKRVVSAVTDSFHLVQQAAQQGQVARAELLAAREKVEVAQATLARFETELKLVTGDGAKAALSDAGRVADLLAVEIDLLAAHKLLTRRQDQVAGPIPDRIRAALDKTVKIGAKDERVSIDQALESFKKLGLDVPVRGDLKKIKPITSLGEELPVGAWFQMFADETPDCLILVREYGLLVATTNGFPPKDAVSLFDFWKQKPAAETPKK